jgi:hypothetical protein
MLQKREFRQVSALILLLLLPACSPTTRSAVTMQDLNDYRVTCDNKPAQMQFLRDQLQASDADSMTNGLIVTNSMGRFAAAMDGTLDDREHRALGYHRTIILQYMRYLKEYCP